jgi:type I pantothenate kinase
MSDATLKHKNAAAAISTQSVQLLLGASSLTRQSSSGGCERFSAALIGDPAVQEATALLPAGTDHQLLYDVTVSAGPVQRAEVSRFVDFSRAQWASLRAATPLPLSEAQLRGLVGLNERMSLDEVADIYLPLSRLLNLYVQATQALHHAIATFLESDAPRVPFVIGLAGSVAAGKSTASRILQALLARWPSHPRVDLIATDGFLWPRRVLEARGLMERKGFPESYDVRRLLRFLADLKSGAPEVHAPAYSHLAYDVVENEVSVIRQPDILIVEGLNVLQTGTGRAPMFVSDFFDFTIYMDANESDIEQWYIERFLMLRETVFRNPSSYFHKYADLTPQAAVDTARTIWRSINLVNLRENVLPTRERAHLILEKGRDHAVRRVRLRKS